MFSVDRIGLDPQSASGVLAFERHNGVFGTCMFTIQVVTGLRYAEFRVQTPTVTRDFSVPLGVLTDCGVHAALYSVDTVGKGTEP